MPTHQFNLAVEEVAYAMGVLGGSETAHGFLVSLLGERPQKEIEGRLLAASHSLVARSLLDFEIEPARTWLNDDLAAAVKAILDQRFSLRCHHNVGSQEQVLALFFGTDGLVVSQQLRREVVSELCIYRNAEDAVNQCLNFFGLPIGSGQPTPALAELPLNILNAWRAVTPDTDVKFLIKPLERLGLMPELAQELALSILATESRGSVSRIEGLQETPVANQGLVLLKGNNRAWAFKIEPLADAKLRVYRGDRPTVAALLQDMILSLFE